VAGGDDNPALTELVQILRQEGVIDEAQASQLAAKAAAAEDRESWVDRISFSGDLRARHESFWYDEDETGTDRNNRFRGRYRARLNVDAVVNDRVEVALRLASGSDDNRSTNQTLGSSLDFDSDPIVFDLAYATLTPWAGGDVPGLERSYLGVDVGKVENPYRWKVGKDFMLWDGDIHFEGASLKFVTEVNEMLDIFATTGFYVIDENSTSKDPALTAIQLGGHLEPGDGIQVGARGSWYRFSALNSAFPTRGASSGFSSSVTSGGGNILDGLTGSAAGNDLSVMETAAYLKLGLIEDWPITLYGTYSTNLDAEGGNGTFLLDTDGDGLPDTTVTTAGASSDGEAWGIGLELGDKKKYAKLGFGYWRIEANAFPSQFIDSDLFDGVTNRSGFAVYGSRQLFANTDLNLAAFFSDEIRSSAPYAVSVSNAERVRLQTDIVFKF
jgi:hypothetical protein